MAALLRRGRPRAEGKMTETSNHRLSSEGRANAAIVEALDYAEASLDEISNPLIKMHLSALIQKARCATDLPSVNWNHGEPYSYCPTSSPAAALRAQESGFACLTIRRAPSSGLRSSGRRGQSPSPSWSR